MKDNKDFLLEKARNYLQLSGNKSDIWIGFTLESYEQLGAFLRSVIHISQKSLFLNEEMLEEEVRIDIYNLLDMAKKIIPHTELEFLDEIKKEINQV